MSPRESLDPRTTQPMEAVERADVPAGDGWQYEPKWDGFRCLAFRRGDDVELWSKAGKSLSRYFPDVVESVQDVRADRFVLDGEIVIPVEGRLSFGDLLMRLHPADARVRRLAAASPATYVVFDLLEEDGASLLLEPLSARRARLERFAARRLAAVDRIELSPATRDREVARRWLSEAGKALDGVVAKRLDAPYLMGDRRAVVKVKKRRTADCVVGGFRRGEGSRRIGSLLLGLYDDGGRLDHVGVASSIRAVQRATLEPRLEALRRPPGFTGRAPGGPSRWTGEERPWEPVEPRIVVEVEYDHVTNGRFRHGTKLLRLRPDKDPRACTLDQIAPSRSARGALPSAFAFADAGRAAARTRAGATRTARRGGGAPASRRATVESGDRRAPRRARGDAP